MLSQTVYTSSRAAYRYRGHERMKKEAIRRHCTDVLWQPGIVLLETFSVLFLLRYSTNTHSVFKPSVFKVIAMSLHNIIVIVW